MALFGNKSLRPWRSKILSQNVKGHIRNYKRSEGQSTLENCVTMYKKIIMQIIENRPIRPDLNAKSKNPVQPIL